MGCFRIGWPLMVGAFQLLVGGAIASSLQLAQGCGGRPQIDCSWVAAFPRTETKAWSLAGSLETCHGPGLAPWSSQFNSIEMTAEGLGFKRREKEARGEARRTQNLNFKVKTPRGSLRLYWARSTGLREEDTLNTKPGIVVHTCGPHTWAEGSEIQDHLWWHQPRLHDTLS